MLLLREPIERGIDALSDLEKGGTVQRFEFAVELAWKTLSDYLEHGGKIVQPATPRAVIKEAYGARILGNGQVWIDMLDHRNLLSQTHDQPTFQKAVLAIGDRYLPVVEDAAPAWLRASAGGAGVVDALWAAARRWHSGDSGRFRSARFPGHTELARPWPRAGQLESGDENKTT